MQELQSLEDIFNKKIFRIPDYQRGYAWGKKQLTDFWEDLVNLDVRRFHYTGVISIKEVPDDKLSRWEDEKWLINNRRYKPFHIVDGQQRMTTTSIFIQCLVEVIRNLKPNIGLSDNQIYLGSYNLVEIVERFIVITQPPTNIVRTYKFGYEIDNPSFEFLRHKIYGEGNTGRIDETFYTLKKKKVQKY